MTYFFDTNVVLDIAQRRQPWLEASAKAVKKASTEGTIMLAPHCFATACYLISKSEGDALAVSALKNLLGLMRVSNFTHKDAVTAFAFNSGDYEDALIIAAAVSNDADVIVTRNPGDFEKSPIQILTPGELLSQ